MSFQLFAFSTGIIATNQQLPKLSPPTGDQTSAASHSTNSQYHILNHLTTGLVPLHQDNIYYHLSFGLPTSTVRWCVVRYYSRKSLSILHICSYESYSSFIVCSVILHIYNLFFISSLHLCSRTGTSSTDVLNFFSCNFKL